MTGRAVLEQTAAVGEPARGRGGAARDVLWVLGTYVVLGVLGAVVWWLLVDPAVFTKQPGGGLGMGEVQLAKRFATDGWYVVVAAVLGVLSGSLLTWWRSRDFLLTAVLLLVGSGVAAGLMSLLGRWIGPADPGAVAGTVAVGAKVPTQLALSATAGYLVWPIAVLAGALFVLWSPPPEPAEPSGISAEAAPSEQPRH
ncbi:MAG: hypothetical protein ACTHKG_05500 [Nocardioides sp.]